MTIGWKQVRTMRKPVSFTNLFVSQIWRALTQYKKLPHTFIYLFAFFLLADVCLIFHQFSYVLILTSHRKGLNTTGTLVTICQNDKFHFSFLYNTYLGLSQAVTSTIRYLNFLFFCKTGKWTLTIPPKHSMLLVRTKALEDQHEENG